EAGNAVTPVPPVVPELDFLLLPQPAATSASTPAAASKTAIDMRFFTLPPPSPDVAVLRKLRREPEFPSSAVSVHGRTLSTRIERRRTHVPAYPQSYLLHCAPSRQGIGPARPKLRLTPRRRGGTGRRAGGHG